VPLPTANSPRRVAALTLIALFVLSCIPRGHAARHGHKSVLPGQNYSIVGPAAIFDFDTDINQDHVTLQSNGYQKTIKIRFGDLRDTALDFSSSSEESGRLVAADIDRDGDIDLVWVGKSDHKEAVIWLNDGDGEFVEATDTSPYASELDWLLSGNEPSGSHSLKRKSKSRILASSFFNDLGLPIVTRFQSSTLILDFVSATETLQTQTYFAPYLQKRGPPTSLS
jgi:FG-GAP-like repeat